jgi:hypothetical protein
LRSPSLLLVERDRQREELGKEEGGENRITVADNCTQNAM